MPDSDLGRWSVRVSWSRQWWFGRELFGFAGIAFYHAGPLFIMVTRPRTDADRAEATRLLATL